MKINPLNYIKLENFNKLNNYQNYYSSVKAILLVLPHDLHAHGATKLKDIYRAYFSPLSCEITFSLSGLAIHSASEHPFAFLRTRQPCLPWIPHPVSSLFYSPHLSISRPILLEPRWAIHISAIALICSIISPKPKNPWWREAHPLQGPSNF